MIINELRRSHGKTRQILWALFSLHPSGPGHLKTEPLLTAHPKPLIFRENSASGAGLIGPDPKHIVPGHGNPVDLATATRDTYDYLVNIRNKVAEYIDGGGEIIDSVKVDQSGFSYLKNFEGLAGRNAQEVFTQMEWE